MEDYRARFVEIYNKNITRPGADRLLSWLETTDFFTAPASTRYHGACECGLVMHSLNVYDAMMQHFYTEGENAESYAICALLHDLCKANFYKVSTRNVKNDATGQWEKPAALRPRRKERVSHRAFHALENRRGYCYPLAYGRV